AAIERVGRTYDATIFRIAHLIRAAADRRIERAIVVTGLVTERGTEPRAVRRLSITGAACDHQDAKQPVWGPHGRATCFDRVCSFNDNSRMRGSRSGRIKVEPDIVSRPMTWYRIALARPGAPQLVAAEGEHMGQAIAQARDQLQDSWPIAVEHA